MSNAQQWASHVDAWRASGESARRYCEERGLKVSSFRYWSKRIRREQAEASEGSAPRVRIARVKTVAPSTSGATSANESSASGIQIVVGAFRVEVAQSFDEATLLGVLGVLSRQGASR